MKHNNVKPQKKKKNLFDKDKIMDQNIDNILKDIDMEIRK